jgi:hypothetical protein
MQDIHRGIPILPLFAVYQSRPNLCRLWRRQIAWWMLDLCEPLSQLPLVVYGS